MSILQVSSSFSFPITKATWHYEPGYLCTAYRLSRYVLVLLAVIADLFANSWCCLTSSASSRTPEGLAAIKMLPASVTPIEKQNPPAASASGALGFASPPIPEGLAAIKMSPASVTPTRRQNPPAALDSRVPGSASPRTPEGLAAIKMPPASVTPIGKQSSPAASDSEAPGSASLRTPEGFSAIKMPPTSVTPTGRQNSPAASDSEAPGSASPRTPEGLAAVRVMPTEISVLIDLPAGTVISPVPGELSAVQQLPEMSPGIPQELDAMKNEKDEYLPGTVSGASVRSRRLSREGSPIPLQLGDLGSPIAGGKTGDEPSLSASKSPPLPDDLERIQERPLDDSSWVRSSTTTPPATPLRSSRSIEMDLKAEGAK